MIDKLGLAGVEEVFASFLWLVMVLISEDFPTFDRPINAYSGKSGSGQSLYVGALFRKMAFLTCIIFWLSGYSSSHVSLFLLRKYQQFL
jgi:hypothetical protein